MGSLHATFAELLIVGGLGLGLPASARAQAEDMPTDPATAAIDEDMWGGDQTRVFDRLITVPASRSEGEFKEGDLVPGDIGLSDLPRDVQQEIIPSASPYSALQWKILRVDDGVALVLPYTRRIVKVFRGAVRAPAAAAPPSAISSPEPATREPAPPQPPIPASAPASDGNGPAPPSLTGTGPANAAAADRTAARHAGADEIDVDELLRRAEESRRRGDILVTRLFLQKAARLGSRLAKYRLAQSYDPRALEEWGALGVRADPERAKRLYREAGPSPDAPEQVKTEQGSR